jgi:hypothetical protein
LPPFFFLSADFYEVYQFPGLPVTHNVYHFTFKQDSSKPPWLQLPQKLPPPFENIASDVKAAALVIILVLFPGTKSMERKTIGYTSPFKIFGQSCGYFLRIFYNPRPTLSKALTLPAAFLCLVVL